MPGRSQGNQTNTIPTFFGTASAPQDMSRGSPKQKQRSQGADTQSPLQKSPETKKMSTRDNDTKMAESQPQGAEVLEMEIDPGPDTEDQGISVNATDEAEVPDENPHNDIPSNEQNNKEDTQGSMEQEDTYDSREEREKTTTAPVLVSPNQLSLQSSSAQNPNNYVNSPSKAAQKLPNPILPRWQSRKSAVSFDIKHQRTGVKEMSVCLQN